MSETSTEAGPSPAKGPRTPPPIALFGGLAFAGSLGIVLTAAFSNVEWGTPAFRAIGVLYMVPPAIAAIIVQGPILKQPIMRPFGFRLSMNAWFLWASFLPLIIAGISLGLSSLFGGVEVAWDAQTFVDINRASVPEDQLEAFDAQVLASSAHPVIRLLLQGVMFGLTVGLFVTLGEEVGWRGFLYHHVRGSFMRRSLLVGAFWGIWYVPLVMQGQFYGEHTYWGALLIIVWTTLMSPLIHYCRARTDSVIAACIFRGTLMAMTQLPFSMTQGGDELTVGLHGFAGLGATAIVMIALLLYDRHIADDPLIFVRA